MRTTSDIVQGTGLRQRMLPILAIAAMTTLQGCFLFNEFKSSAWAIRDDCFTLVAADFCIDFDTGVLAASGVSATIGGGTNCLPIRRVKVTGWIDKDGDGAEGPGEAIESLDHTVPERSGSSSVQLGNVSLALNATPSEASDVHLRIEVERVGAQEPQVYNQRVSKC